MASAPPADDHGSTRRAPGLLHDSTAPTSSVAASTPSSMARFGGERDVDLLRGQIWGRARRRPPPPRRHQAPWGEHAGNRRHLPRPDPTFPSSSLFGYWVLAFFLRNRVLAFVGLGPTWPAKKVVFSGPARHRECPDRLCLGRRTGMVDWDGMARRPIMPYRAVPYRAVPGSQDAHL